MMRRRSQARSGVRVRRRVRRPSGWVLGWAAAAVVLVGLAVIVGRPGAEQDLLGGDGQASPTPTGPARIAFGATLDPGSGQVAGRTDRFAPGDSFAYAVALDGRASGASVLVEVVRLGDDSREVVQEPLAQEVGADGALVAVELPADRLIAAWGPGAYEMRIYLAADGPVAARGRFSLSAEPET